VKWSKKVPGADRITPLGGGAMVQDTNSSERYVKAFGADGALLLDDAGKDLTGVRVAPGSVLLFSDIPEPFAGDESLYGFTARTRTRTPLGDAKKIRSANCSWNARLLVCPTDNDFGIWRFGS
jgi:hypothetical protein